MKRQVLKVALLGANAVLMAAAVGMVPEWRHGTDPERPRAVSLDVERPTWWPGGANNRDSAVQAYGRDAVAKWGELVPAPSFLRSTPCSFLNSATT